MVEMKEEKAVDKEELAKAESLLHQKKKERKQLIQLIILIAVIAVILALASGTFSGLKFSSAPNALPVDTLHDLNKQGKLSKDRGYMYGDHSIVKNDGLWWSDVYVLGTLYKTPLHFGPKELENITISGQLNDSFNQQQDIYLAINPETSDKYYSLAVSELSLNLAKVMNRAPIGACTTKNDLVCPERKVVSCTNPNGSPTIELELSDTPSIQLQGSCIKITGREYGLTRAVDRLLYRWYGVMQ